MNDDFIYNALPEVKKEFADSLYRRISNNKLERLRRLKLNWSRMALVALGALLLIAWVQFRLWIRYVPIGELWLVEVDRIAQNSSTEPASTLFIPTPLPTSLKNRILVGFIPLWAPEGFTFEPEIAGWRNNAQEEIHFSFGPRAGTMHPVVAPGMWKEVRVDSEPAILIYGRFAPANPENPSGQREWEQNLGLQLHWIIGDYVYTLETFGPYLSEQDLIRIAESIP